MTMAIKRKIRFSSSCLMILYLAGLVYFLFFSEQYGRSGSGMYGCNFRPFHEICRYLEYWELLGTQTVLLNLAGNIIGFMPLGFLTPILFKEARKLWKTTVLCLEVSILVEIAQLLFRVGSFDVDDIILNTLGGILGFCVFTLIDSVYGKIIQRKKHKST